MLLLSPVSITVHVVTEFLTVPLSLYFSSATQIICDKNIYACNYNEPRPPGPC